MRIFGKFWCKWENWENWDIYKWEFENLWVWSQFSQVDPPPLIFDGVAVLRDFLRTKRAAIESKLKYVFVRIQETEREFVPFYPQKRHLGPLQTQFLHLESSGGYKCTYESKINSNRDPKQELEPIWTKSWIILNNSHFKEEVSCVSCVIILRSWVSKQNF